MSTIRTTKLESIVGTYGLCRATGKEQAVEVRCDERVAIRSSPGKMDRVVIGRRLGNAAAFASTGSYPTVAIPAAAAGYVEKKHNLKFASIQLGANFGI